MQLREAEGSPRTPGSIGNVKLIAEMSTDELLAELQAHHRETGQFFAAQRHGSAACLMMTRPPAFMPGYTAPPYQVTVLLRLMAWRTLTPH